MSNTYTLAMFHDSLQFIIENHGRFYREEHILLISSDLDFLHQKNFDMDRKRTVFGCKIYDCKQFLNNVDELDPLYSQIEKITEYVEKHHFIFLKINYEPVFHLSK